MLESTLLFVWASQRMVLPIYSKNIGRFFSLIKHTAGVCKAENETFLILCYMCSHVAHLFDHFTFGYNFKMLVSFPEMYIYIIVWCANWSHAFSTFNIHKAYFFWKIITLLVALASWKLGGIFDNFVTAADHTAHNQNNDAPHDSDNAENKTSFLKVHGAIDK